MSAAATPHRQHAGVARARCILAAYAPATAHEFERVTAAAAAACGTAAWTGGYLNQTDAPLEFSFSSASRDLRYTMEVGASAAAPATRLAAAGAVLDALGVDPAWTGVARGFPALQRGAPLDWGAWLAARQPGGAHPAGAATRFKLYAEVADASGAPAAALLRKYVKTMPLALASRARLVMVGAAPGAERCEFYFELGSRALSLEHLRGLLAHVGLAHHGAALAALVNGFDFRHGRVAQALPRAQYGFSYSLLPDGEEAEFALFAFAADLAGGEAGVRRQVLAAARRGGLDPEPYAAITAPLAHSQPGQRYHNMLTFFAGERALPGWQISVSPPPG